jgi:hypothetical protein
VFCTGETKDKPLMGSFDTATTDSELHSAVGNIPYNKAFISSGLKSGVVKGFCKKAVGKFMVNPVIYLMKDGTA